MSEIIKAVGDVVSEPAPYVAMSTGAGMTQVPITWVQIVGMVIGAGGLYVGVLRWRVADRQQKENKRANDLNQEKWEYEKNAKSSNIQKTEK